MKQQEIETKIKIQRFLELLPGIFSYTLITMPIWLSFSYPQLVAYFVIVFNVYWLYRSAQMALYSIQAYLRMKAHEQVDWKKEIEDIPNPSLNPSNLLHIVIIPTYKEPYHTLERTVESISQQTFPTKQIAVVLATELRDENAPEIAAKLKDKFENKFAHFFITTHPDIVGETKGKSSNMAWAGKWVKAELEKQGYLIENVTITSCDADSVLPPHYFTYLSYRFITDPNRYLHIYQGALMYYNNIWKVPLPIRVINTLGSIWNLAVLMRPDKLINMSTYTLSLKLCHEIGYWSVDVIPEDWHLFFKAFFAKKGQVEVEPLFLAIYSDAAESTTYFKTITNQYNQMKRWAWGITDDPYIIIQWYKHREIPFWKRTIRVVRALESHFLWPVNWFILTLGANIPSILNEKFKETVLGRDLPRISSAILTLCLISLFTIIIIDSKAKPPRPASFPRKYTPILFAQWLTVPIVTFFLSALPGLDAHTRLMLGKYLDYKVTEKV